MRALAVAAAALALLPACHKLRPGVAPHPPAGYVTAEVGELVPDGGGARIDLVDRARHRSFPMWIGGTEARSITLRVDGRRYERPLTHDLVDTLLREFGGRVVQVQVDDLRNNTFLGTIVVQHGRELVPIDARPSDAIALALGAKAPIYVRSDVFTRAGGATQTAAAPTTPIP
jgi:bifunctional DNase/RNase